MPAYFDEISTGMVSPLGVAAVSPEDLAKFITAFAPGWDAERGLPDALIYTLWAKLDSQAAVDWPQTKRVATDALRFARNPPAGELLRGRMTVLGMDPVGESKGIVLCQHDLLDEAGRLVFSCLTRSVFACAPERPAGLDDEV